jgi:hypothetical protein
MHICLFIINIRIYRIYTVYTYLFRINLTRSQFGIRVDVGLFMGHAVLN